VKVAVCVALLVFSAVCLVFGLASTVPFTQTAWAELLWVALGILVTTFLIDYLVSRDSQRRRRSQLQLGLRYQAARALEHVTRIVGDGKLGEAADLATSVTRGGAEYRGFIDGLLAEIERPGAHPSLDEYDLRRVEIAGVLHDLAYNVVHVDSPGEELVGRSRALTELALVWHPRGDDAAGRAAVIDLANRTGAAIAAIVRDAAGNSNFELAE
jgi:hypothetical protein